jgi:cellulose biosynthesis protein BcsQ
MFVLPASNAQRLVESDPEAPASIIERFQEIRTFSDVVIVDTSPGINNIHVGLYYASDYVLLPTLCEFDSILSLGTGLEYLHNATASGVEAGYSVAGLFWSIIPNRFNAFENVQKVKSWVLIRGQYYDKSFMCSIMHSKIWSSVGGKQAKLRKAFIPFPRRVVIVSVGMLLVPKKNSNPCWIPY